VNPNILRFLKLQGVHKKNRRAPAWEHATEVLKSYALTMAAAQTGAAHIYTLRLGPEVIAAAFRSGAAASYLQKRVARYLSKKIGRFPEFWGHLELTPGAGELHLHGVLVAGEGEREAICEALKEAGGRWNPNSQGGQVHLQPLQSVKQWARYTTKGTEIERTRAVMRQNLPATATKAPAVIFATKDLRDAAKAVYAREREKPKLIGKAIRDIEIYPKPAPAVVPVKPVETPASVAPAVTPAGTQKAEPTLTERVQAIILKRRREAEESRRFGEVIREALSTPDPEVRRRLFMDVETGPPPG